jgi:predicted helicase
MEKYKKKCEGKKRKEFPNVNDNVDSNPLKISWSDGFKNSLQRFLKFSFDKNLVITSHYRPFVKQSIYFSRDVNERVYQLPVIFPNPTQQNLVIAVTGAGSSKEFSALIINTLPDLELISKSQCFPLYLYEEREGQYIQSDAISDIALGKFKEIYNIELSNNDIFYYIYGVLNSLEYKSRFEADLKKMIPRIPFAKDFWSFSKAGRELAEWHLNYEAIEPYDLNEIAGDLLIDPNNDYRVIKMAFGKKEKKVDKSTIIYNGKIALSGIPLDAYDYVVNGKPAIEWLMERYRVTVDKKSGIKNDPNDYSDDPRYIIDLVKRVVRVSIETNKIVNSLPPLNELN